MEKVNVSIYFTAKILIKIHILTFNVSLKNIKAEDLLLSMSLMISVL